MLYVGIDWADNGGSAVAAMDEKGEVMRKWVVREKVEDYERIAMEVSAVCGAPAEVAFAIETPHHPLLHFLVEKGYTGYAPNPKSVDRAREIECPSGKKDDFFDAVTLANMVRVDRGRLRPFTPDSAATVKLRSLCEAHRSLVEGRTVLINQATHCLKAYWPEALEFFSRLDGKAAGAFFSRWPDPVAAGRAHRRSVRAHLRGHGYTREKGIEKICGLLRRPTLPVGAAVRDAGGLRLGLLMEQLAVVRGQTDALEERIFERFEAHPDAHIFRSLLINKDSTSRVLVARLLCHFGDRRDRYVSHREILALSGLSPVTYKSGGGPKVVKMRRACRKNFRNDVHILADLYRQRYPWAAGIYSAHRNVERGHNAALRALGAALVKIVFAMWKNGAEFDANIYLARRGGQQLAEQSGAKAKKKGGR